MKWEYKELYLSVTVEFDLNQFGAEGWELVAIVAGFKDWAPKAYFKRPIKNARGPFIKRGEDVT